MTQLFCGIDPGLRGCIALIDGNRKVLSLDDTPTLLSAKDSKGKRKRVLDRAALLRVIARIADNGRRELSILVEKVHAIPEWGAFPSFQFGLIYGATLMALDAYALPYKLLTPTQWKKKVYPKGSRLADKEMAILLAKELFPDIPIPRDDVAEALLLADISRRGG